MCQNHNILLYVLYKALEAKILKAYGLLNLESSFAIILMYKIKYICIYLPFKHDNNPYFNNSLLLYTLLTSQKRQHIIFIQKYFMVKPIFVEYAFQQTHTRVSKH